MFAKLFKSRRAAPAPAAAATASPAADAQAEALVAAGNAAEDAGRVPEALALYAKAVALAPALPAAHLNLGIAQEASGDEAAARASYAQVLQLAPGHPFGAYNLAKLEYTAGRLAAAEGLLRQAVAARPQFGQAWILLSNVLDAAGSTQAAADAGEQALRLRPDDAGALYNQAGLLRRLGRLDEALAAACRAAELAPDQVDPAALQMQMLYAQGFAAEALPPLRRAIRLAPQRLDLRSRELFLLNLVELESAQQVFERHARLGRELEAAVPARQHPRPLARKPRLRIGLVSEDFCFHPVALFLIPWLEGRSRDRFEVVCYSSTPGDNEIMQRIRALADRWVDASPLHDLQLADAIAGDGIDLLLDLGGHTGAVRLGVFAARPAPVQASWMGYLNTTGLSRIDFRITDARCDPPAISQPLHTERLLALPGSQWCYRPFLRIAHADAAPCERNGFITFGSFNNVTKLTEPLAERWGRILQAVPGSRLLVAAVPSQRKRAALLDAVAACGVDRGRVEFTPRVDLERYYRLMDRVDIALDSYPYGGGTTTFDALWMGVPVLTASGDLPASRSAASILAALGLDEWVAAGIDDYERVAVARAADLAAIASLRHTLRQRLQASPLMDEARFVAAFEQVLERAWSQAVLPGNADSAAAAGAMQ